MKIIFNKVLKYKVDIITLVLIFILVWLAYGQTVNMFYWIDDWGMLFNMIHPTIFPGNFGQPAYRYNTTPFVLLYPFVGLDARTYFVLGLIQYFIAAVMVFFITKVMTKNRMMSLVAAIIFSSGYIGSYAMYRLSNSYQLTGTTIFMILTVWPLLIYYQARKIKFYLFSLILFAATLEFFFLRTPGILLIVFAISILYGNFKFKKSSILLFLIQHLPYVVVYGFFNFWDSRIMHAGSSSSRDAIQRSVDIIFKEKNFELLNNLIISITNTIVPDRLTHLFYDYLASFFPYISGHTKLIITLPGFVVGLAIFFYWLKTRKNLLSTIVSLTFMLFGTIFVIWSSIQQGAFWNPNTIELFTSALGTTLFGFLIWLYFTFRDTEQNIAKLFILGLIWIFAVVFGYFLYSPSTNLESTSRYLIPGFVGTTLIYATIFYLLPKLFTSKDRISKTCTTILVLLLSAVLIIYSRQEQDQIISTISNPSKEEFNVLQKELGGKGVSKQSIFHLETIDDSVLRHDILGGMPHVSVAIAAGLDDGAIIADSYEHLIYLASIKNYTLENIYSFFATKTSFVSTTQLLRRLLNEASAEQKLVGWRTNTKILEGNDMYTKTIITASRNGTIGINPVLEVDTTNPSLVPSELKLTMSVSPIQLTTQIFPYFDYSQKVKNEVDLSYLAYKAIPEKKAIIDENILSILTIEKDKFNMRSKASVRASSSGRNTEEKNVLDGRLDTNWAAEGGNWNRGELPQTLTIDLGDLRSVDTLTWVNHYIMATPTVYSIEYSLDERTWIKVKEVSDRQQLTEGKVISIDLGTVEARYIRMNIYDTYRGRGYPPAIKEIWVSRGSVQLDSLIINEAKECPFCFVTDVIRAQKILELIYDVSEAKIFWTTDRNIKYNDEYNTSFLLNLDGNPHTYKVILPPQGTHYQKIKIDNFKLPVNVILHDASLRPLTFREMKERNLIKQFAE